VSGLGSAARVHILDDMRGAIQHHNHLTFEFGWQNRLHTAILSNGRVITKMLCADAQRVRFQKTPSRVAELTSGI
jgi:hypothetical protein